MTRDRVPYTEYPRHSGTLHALIASNLVIGHDGAPISDTICTRMNLIRSEQGDACIEVYRFVSGAYGSADLRTIPIPAETFDALADAFTAPVHDLDTTECPTCKGDGRSDAGKAYERGRSRAVVERAPFERRVLRPGEMCATCHGEGRIPA